MVRFMRSRNRRSTSRQTARAPERIRRKHPKRIYDAFGLISRVEPARAAGGLARGRSAVLRFCIAYFVVFPFALIS